MNTAIVKNVACAKNGSPTLFVESKSGNVYKLNASVPADRAPTIIAKIKAAGVINIKLWTKVREGRYVKPEPRPRLTRDKYIALHGSLPADKSYSVVDADGYPTSMGEAS